MKSYTDLPQSKKLAKILPLESADMIWVLANPDLPMIKAIAYEDSEKSKYYEILPAWSLAALLSVLPDETTDDDGDVYRNMFFHLKGKYIIQYPRLTTLWPSLLFEEADNPVDACYEMVLKLHELNLL